MKKRLLSILLTVFILMITGCGNSNGTEELKTDSKFEELDVDYTTNDDGTYTCRDNIYKYKIEVSGIEGESQVTFIVLANDTEISFEDIFDSLKKAEISTGVPEFVILGWYNGI